LQLGHRAPTYNLPGTPFSGHYNNKKENTMSETTQEFYDVRLREKVQIPISECAKTVYTVKNRTRYAMKAVSKASGKDTKVTLFITEARYKELDIPTT